jgi:5-methylcytosine-specific restriction endonuclease McrA
MNRMTKSARLRLEPEAYEALRNEVLCRDGWRCQLCGGMMNLEVHHRQFRSHSGDDLEENLITLCDLQAKRWLKCQPRSYVRLEAYSFFGLSEGA